MLATFVIVNYLTLPFAAAICHYWNLFNKPTKRKEKKSKKITV